MRRWTSWQATSAAGLKRPRASFPKADAPSRRGLPSARKGRDAYQYSSVISPPLWRECRRLWWERGDTARSIPGDLEMESSDSNALKLNAARPSSEIWTAPY